MATEVITGPENRQGKIIKSLENDGRKTMAVLAYRTQDGLNDYGFSIEFQPTTGWHVYIILDPFREGQSNSPPMPYQSVDDYGRHYVNWPSKLDSLGDAKAVAQLWAELAQRHERAQVKHKLYADLVQCYQRTQKRR